MHFTWTVIQAPPRSDPTCDRFFLGLGWSAFELSILTTSKPVDNHEARRSRNKPKRTLRILPTHELYFPVWPHHKLTDHHPSLTSAATLARPPPVSCFVCPEHQRQGSSPRFLNRPSDRRPYNKSFEWEKGCFMNGSSVQPRRPGTKPARPIHTTEPDLYLRRVLTRAPEPGARIRLLYRTYTYCASGP